MTRWGFLFRALMVVGAAVGLLVPARLAGDILMVTKDTDEFSGIFPAPGTLRSAIFWASVYQGPHQINFDIPGSGVHTIKLVASLPPSSRQQVTIDGYTQPGAHPNTLVEGDDAVLLIEVDGDLVASTGISLVEDGCRVKGLVMNRFLSSAIRLDSKNNVVEGNFIGTDPSGTSALPNGIGVRVDGSNNTVGGTTPAARNVVSGNNAQGVLADAAAAGLLVRGNYIGTTASGTLALPNGAEGVLFQNGGGGSVGGIGEGAGNVIGFNGGAGVSVPYESGVAVQGNSILSNGDLGIDRGADGVTPNGTGSPGNYPLLLSAGSTFAPPTGAGSQFGATTIAGSLDSVPSTPGIRVEFFSNATCDPSGYGEGESFIGSMLVSTDATGHADFATSISPPVPIGSFITATATVPGFDTSELSACQAVGSSPGVQVLGIVPNSGPAAGGEPIVAFGVAFESGATLLIGGAPAGNVHVLSATEIDAEAPTREPGTLNDVAVTNPGGSSASLVGGWFADFLDVAGPDGFHPYVETIFRAGITAGCGGGNYCRDQAVSRAQMAVFLLKAEHGPAYLPPICAGVFADVPCPSDFADWVEQLALEGIAAGCGGASYCPTNPVTRAQMAALLLRTKHGAGYTPPSCTGVFEDVACPSPFADWIEELHIESVTGGCSADPVLYCPDSPNSRGQMAVFLVNAFGMD